MFCRVDVLQCHSVLSDLYPCLWIILGQNGGLYKKPDRTYLCSYPASWNRCHIPVRCATQYSSMSPLLELLACSTENCSFANVQHEKKWEKHLKSSLKNFEIVPVFFANNQLLIVMESLYCHKWTLLNPCWPIEHVDSFSSNKTSAFKTKNSPVGVLFRH